MELIEPTLYYFTFTEKIDFKFLFNLIFYYEIYK